MSELFDKSIRTLELPRVLQLLSEQAVSPEAKELALAVRPETDYEDVLRLLDQTDGARAMIVLRGAPGFSGVKPVKDLLDRADRGGSLNIPELIRIGDLLYAARRAKEYFNADAAEPTALDQIFLSIHGNRFLEDKIRRCISDENTVADAASPELADIRRHMRAALAKSRQILQKIISSPSYSKVLQDNIITQRDGRFVVPVKADQKGNLPGLIHDVSSTGATVFVEPMGVVQANNEYAELQAKEQAEIDRILAELSADAAAHRRDIQWDHDALVQLDLIFARGELSYKMDAIRPQVRRDGLIRLRKARHPLLDKKTAVPIDIELGGAFDTLVITGPNTGGKTVSLKTVGLFTLMGQAGLHIPALDRSELALFENVYADIGDEQSIEQSLSTFSSHMTNIVSFLKHVDEHSLVLFDELNAGTDPTEGAALAIAILSYLHQRGIRTMATTHYSELKVFALSTPGVENACCEFDVETLSPTYRLLIGIPGKSNAFAIAGKLGLPDYIIDDARTHLTEQDESFEDLLTDLETSKRTIRKEQEEIEHYKRELERLEEETRQKRDKLEEQRDRIIREANEKAHEILADAKETADETMRNFHKFGKANISVAEMEKERERLRKKMNATQNSMKTDAKKPKKTYKASDFKLGESVKVLSMNLTGSVTSLPDAKGNVTVQMGILRSTVNISDLEIIDEAPAYSFAGRTRQTGKGKVKMGKSLAISPEINLLGKTVDEAVAELDKYLDDASLAHLSSVRIVHGKGTGALRAGIHKYLKRQKHVKSFRLGAFGEGDAGVTIAELK